MLERTDAITNEVLEPITFVLAYPTVYIYIYIYIYVNCTLVQALMFCTGRTAHRGSRAIALLFHDHGTRKV